MPDPIKDSIDQAEPAKETTEAAIARVAEVKRGSLAEYDKIREDEADKIGIRRSTLDAETDIILGADKNDNVADNLGLTTPKPWPEPVDGDDLLARLVDALKSHVVMSMDNARAVAAWIIHAHCHDCWDHTPRLNIRAPEKGCGKSTLLDVITPLTPRALKSESVKSAGVFRLIEMFGPTLLVDEYDSVLVGRDADKELCSILNAGHSRSGRAIRCEGDDNIPKGFRVFGPAALAGIGYLPGTLADRAIHITLNRKSAEETIAPFRIGRHPRLDELASQTARWVEDHREELNGSEPDMPAGVINRDADVWRPGFAIADVAGGKWPDLMRETAGRMIKATKDDTESYGVMALFDIRILFNTRETDKLTSASICENFAEKTDRPWPEYRNGRPISPRQLAQLMKGYAIKSDNLNLGGEARPKGYRLERFEKAFSSYLPPYTPPGAATPLLSAENRRFSDIPAATFGSSKPKKVADKKCEKPQRSANSSGVADKKGGTEGKEAFLPSFDSAGDEEEQQAIRLVDQQDGLCIQCCKPIEIDQETTLTDRGEIHEYCYDDWWSSLPPRPAQ